MSELFQMVSGTSTGSLLTTAIVLPDPNDPTKNKFWASNASNIYKNNGAMVFKTFDLPLWVRFLGTIGLTIIGGLLGFCIGVKLYHNKEHEKSMQSFNEYIKKRKEHALKKRKATINNPAVGGSISQPLIDPEKTQAQDDDQEGAQKVW
jgi:hypothetical protein